MRALRRYRGTAGRVLAVAGLLGALSARPVSAQGVAEVQVAPGVLTLHVGHGERLRATAYDSSGNVITTPVRWRWVSANVNVARVDSLGTVTAVGPGSVLVRAEILGPRPLKSGAATVTVRR